MSKKYTEQENTWAAMISNCKITEIQIGWAREMIRDDLEAAGRGNEYDPNCNPTFAQIVAACKKEEYELLPNYRIVECEEGLAPPHLYEYIVGRRKRI